MKLTNIDLITPTEGGLYYLSEGNLNFLKEPSNLDEELVIEPVFT